jgi:hypothetical protein
MRFCHIAIKIVNRYNFIDSLKKKGEMANRKEIIPSETAVRISMPYLTNLIVSLPLVGMVASFITSVLFTKEQIFESECGVSISI